MAMTLNEAFEAYKKARARKAETAAARREADERAEAAKQDDQAAGTAMDNAKQTLDNYINMLSDPK